MPSEVLRYMTKLTNKITRVAAMLTLPIFSDWDQFWQILLCIKPLFVLDPSTEISDLRFKSEIWNFGCTYDWQS